MLKKSKLIIGISCIVQGFSFLILFFSFLNKKKGLANTFLAVSLCGGAFGALLLLMHSHDEKKQKRMRLMDDYFEDMEPLLGVKSASDDFEDMQFVENDIDFGDMEADSDEESIFDGEKDTPSDSEKETPSDGKKE